MTRSEATLLALAAVEALDAALAASLPLPGDDAVEGASHLRVAREQAFAAYRRLAG